MMVHGSSKATLKWVWTPPKMPTHWPAGEFSPRKKDRVEGQRPTGTGKHDGGCCQHPQIAHTGPTLGEFHGVCVPHTQDLGGSETHSAQGLRKRTKDTGRLGLRLGPQQ